jgi:predicted O-methyltransferase YrrM
MDTIDKLRKRASEQFAVAVQDIREAGTDSLSHFGNGYLKEGGLSLQQNPDEFAALLVFLNRVAWRDVAYLEIGSASGGAAVMIHRWTGWEEMYSIDDGQHPRYEELHENFKEISIEHVRCDSHGNAARDFLDCLEFDVAFIDGDHSEAGVWQDVELVRPHLPPGSFIIFHDTVTLAVPGVGKAWRRGIDEGIWAPIAEYVGVEKPLGIGVGLIV